MTDYQSLRKKATAYGGSGFKAKMPSVPGRGGLPKKPQLIGGLSKNPNTGEYMLGGVKVSSQDGWQGLSRIRDKMKEDGIKDPFNHESPVEEGFFPVNDESKKKIDNQLGYLRGTLEGFLGSPRDARAEMQADLKSIKDPKKRAEKSKEWQRYINTEFAKTDSEDVGNLTAKGLGRSSRDILTRGTGGELVAEAIGGAVGSVLGPAGVVAGTALGSQIAKEAGGNEETINEIKFGLERQGIDTTNPEVQKDISDAVETGGYISSAVSGATGGVGRVFMGSAKKQITKNLIKKFTNKAILKQGQKKVLGKTGEVIKKLESPILGTALASGVEGMAGEQAVQQAVNDRNMSPSEAIKAFVPAAAQGGIMAGAFHAAGALYGIATNKVQTKLQSSRNKGIVNLIESDKSDLTSLRMKATGEDFATSKKAILKEYNSMANQNIDLANKANKDWSTYSKAIKENKNIESNPIKADELKSSEESVRSTTDLDNAQKELDIFDLTKEASETPRETTSSRTAEIKPTKQELDVLSYSTIGEGVDVIKKGPWSDSTKMKLYKNLVSQNMDDLSFFKEKGLNENVLKTWKPKDIASETFGDTIGSRTTNTDVLAHIKNIKDINELKAFAEKVNHPEIQELVSNPSTRPIDLIRKLEAYYGKGVMGEVGYTKKGNKVLLNTMVPEKSRKGSTKRSNENYSKHVKYLDDMLDKQFGFKPRKFEGSNQYNLDAAERNILIKNINEDLDGTGATFDDINNAYKQEWGQDIEPLQLVDLATRNKFELRHHLENVTKLTEKNRKGELGDKIVSETLNSMTPEKRQSFNRAVEAPEMTAKDLGNVQKIFDQVKGKLKGVELGGFTNKKGAEGYIKLVMNDAMQADIIKVAKFLDADSLKRVLRHETSHFVIRKALTASELKSFVSSLSKDGEYYNKTVKYMESKGYSKEQISDLSSNIDELGANFMEGAWEGKIDLNPDSIGKKAINAIKLFFAKIRRAFTGEFKNTQDLMATIRAGRLERDGLVKFGKEGIDDISAGSKTKTLLSEIPEDIREAMNKKTTMDMINEDLNDRASAFHDLVNEYANKQVEKANPLLFKWNKYFGQNAVLLARKYPLVGNIYNFVDKALRIGSVVKNHFNESLEPISKMSRPELEAGIKEYNNAKIESIRSGTDLDANDFLHNQVAKVMIDAEKYSRQGGKESVDKFNKLAVGLKQSLNNDKVMSVPTRMINEITQLADSTIGRKYKQYVKLARLKGNLITIDSKVGDSPLDLPMASFDKNKNYLSETPDNMLPVLTDFIDNMIPSSIGGGYKPKDKISGVFATFAKLAYPLQLGFKASSVPVNIIGGLASALTAGGRHNGIPGMMSAFKNFATTPFDGNIWLGRNKVSGKDAKHISRAMVEGVTDGDRMSYEGETKDFVRQTENVGLQKAARAADAAGKGLMVFTNKGNQIQRQASFKTGLDTGRSKGIIDPDQLYEFAVRFTNEAAGDFRSFARPGQQGVIRLLNMFKSEPQFAMQNLVTLARERPKMLAGPLAYYIASSGLTGIPYIEDLFDILDGLIAATGETGTIRTDLADALGNMLGDKKLGKQIVMGTIAPGFGIGYSLTGGATTTNFPQIFKSLTKKKPSLSTFDLPAAVAIPTGAAAGLMKGIGGRTKKDRKQSVGLPKRIQAAYRLATGSTSNMKGDKAVDYLYKLIGISNPDLDEYYNTREYFDTK